LLSKRVFAHSRPGSTKHVVNVLEIPIGPPVVVVLCKGDGDRDDIDAHRMGFPRMVTELLRSGAFVEVWSWKHSCSNAFRKISSERYQLNYLDERTVSLSNGRRDKNEFNGMVARTVFSSSEAQYEDNIRDRSMNSLF
jgi:hypothetical protein